MLLVQLLKDISHEQEEPKIKPQKNLQLMNDSCWTTAASDM